MNPYHFTFKQVMSIYQKMESAGVDKRNIVSELKPRFDYDTLEILLRPRDGVWYNLQKNIPPLSSFAR